MTKLDALLVFPPPYIPTEIQPGIAAIQGACKAKGLRIEVEDANIGILERVLIDEDPSAKEAIDTLKDPKSYTADNFKQFHDAKETLAEIADRINNRSSEAFMLRRNTIQYIPRYDAQSREGVLRAIEKRHKENNDIFTRYLEDTASKIKPSRVYGVGITDRKQAIPGFVLASFLKEKHPDSVVVLGGNFISRAREVFSKDDKLNRMLFDYIDFMQYLEGDESFPRLVEAIKNNEKNAIQGIEKLIYKDARGKIIDTGMKQIVNVRELPLPDYNGLKAWTPEPAIAYNFQRGCLYGKCSFCGIMDGYDGFSQRTKENPYIFTPRKKHLDEVMDDIRKLVRQGYHFINFTDETFFAADLEKLSRRILEENIKIKFTWYARVEKKYSDPEFAKLVAEAGGLFAQFGVESSSVRTLDYMNKGVDNLNIYDILKTTHKAGIMNHVFLLVGYPGESVEDALKLFDFLEETKDYTFTIKPTWFKLAKGSPDAYKEKGYGFERTFQEGDLAPNLTYKKTKGMSKKTAQAINYLLDSWIQRFHNNNYVAGDYSYSQRLFSGPKDMLRIADQFRANPELKEKEFRPTEPLSVQEKESMKRVWKELVGNEYFKAYQKYKRGNRNPHFLKYYGELKRNNEITDMFPEGISSYEDLHNVNRLLEKYR